MKQFLTLRLACEPNNSLLILIGRKGTEYQMAKTNKSFELKCPNKMFQQTFAIL